MFSILGDAKNFICGCRCMPSALSGVSEIMQYCKFGKLIENQHFVSDWAAAIEEF